MDDNFHGEGKIYYPNGNYYIGEFKYGLRDGKGSLFYKNGKIKYSGNYEKNVCDNKYKDFDKDGKDVKFKTIFRKFKKGFKKTLKFLDELKNESKDKDSFVFKNESPDDSDDSDNSYDEYTFFIPKDLENDNISEK